VTLRTLLLATVLVVAVLSAGCVGPFAGDSTPAATETPDPTPTASETPPGAGTTPTATGVHSSYDQTTVTVVDDETGEELGRVEAAIADNASLRYTGLSDTDELPEDRGMLFTYDDDRELTYVMRNMSFDLDIVFVYGNGTIESIHHKRAPAPDEDGESIRASGEGQYVLEVNRGWTTERGVEEGDRLEFDLPE